MGTSYAYDLTRLAAQSTFSPLSASPHKTPRTQRCANVHTSTNSTCLKVELDKVLVLVLPIFKARTVRYEIPFGEM